MRRLPPRAEHRARTINHPPKQGSDYLPLLDPSCTKGWPTSWAPRKCGPSRIPWLVSIQRVFRLRQPLTDCQRITASTEFPAVPRHRASSPRVARIPPRATLYKPLSAGATVSRWKAPRDVERLRCQRAEGELGTGIAPRFHGTIKQPSTAPDFRPARGSDCQVAARSGVSSHETSWVVTRTQRIGSMSNTYPRSSWSLIEGDNRPDFQAANPGMVRLRQRPGAAADARILQS